jgi:hypothetical protein
MIVSGWITKSPERKGGVKGAHPLGCLPLWGREGVTLLTPTAYRKVTGKRRFQRNLKISEVRDSGLKRKR